MNFIKQLNSNLPTLEEVKSRYKEKLNVDLDTDTSKIYLSKMEIQAKMLLGEENFVKNLIEESNIWQIGIGSIVFMAELEFVDDMYAFADYKDGQYVFYIDSKDKCWIKTQQGDHFVFFDTINVLMNFFIFYHKLNYDKFYRKIDSLSHSDLESYEEYVLLDKSSFMVKDLIREMYSVT